METVICVLIVWVIVSLIFMLGWYMAHAIENDKKHDKSNDIK